jgi:glutamyl-tRNA reductase
VTLVYIGKSIANQIANPLASRLDFCSFEELNQSKISHDEYPLLLDQIKLINFVEEACLISTCNRFELIVWSLTDIDEPTIQSLKQILRGAGNTNADYNVLLDKEAELQITRTYCGLNSSLVGEKEITAQFEISFKQCLHMGYLGPQLMSLYSRMQKTRKLIDKEIFTQTISYCSLAIERSLRSLEIERSNKILVFGSGSTAYQTILALIEQNINPANITLIHRISSTSTQIASFLANRSMLGLNYLRCKDGYHISRIKEFSSDADLLIFTIDSKNPVIKIGSNSQSAVIDFNSRASCEYETNYSKYISSKTLNQFVSEFSNKRNQDEDFKTQIEEAENLIAQTLGSSLILV